METAPFDIKNLFRAALLWRLLVALWVLFSLAYIGNDFWKQYVTKRVDEARQVGRTELVNDILRLAKSCEPFPVFNGDNRANLVEIDCLRRAAAGQGAAGAANRPAPAPGTVPPMPQPAPRP
ncbi:MAG: hypothetical protein HY903_23180 [Deltaproteobacteria bacterium]|nr:hypothetical protein [Deltaproteobacteria bacterium]